MSPLFAERPPSRFHKCFVRKELRHFYVPFVDQTDARCASVKGVAWVGCLRAERGQVPEPTRVAWTVRSA
jgi:hypothetical protein